MNLFQRVAGHPFVYDYVRPLVVGGIDMRASYANLDAAPGDVIADIGCGTGDALRYLADFREYHGFDGDASAIAAARRRPQASRPGVHFYERTLERDDLERLEPTRVMMSGLLHHLSDEQAIALLKLCATAPSVKRIATNDPVFVDRNPVSNLLSRMDRGHHVRDADGYRRLVERAGLSIVDARTVRSHPRTGLAMYYLMAIAPAH